MVEASHEDPLNMSHVWLAACFYRVDREVMGLQNNCHLEAYSYCDILDVERADLLSQAFKSEGPIHSKIDISQRIHTQV